MSLSHHDCADSEVTEHERIEGNVLLDLGPIGFAAKMIGV
jgi:hypothetical protein